MNSTTTEESWSINFSDPWTIAAIVLLGLLLFISFIRLYQNCKPKIGVKTNNIQPVRIEPVEKKKTTVHHQTRAQMRI